MSMVKWAPENGTRLGVMPRLGGADDIRWYEVEPSHVQHFWNAWVEGNRIELAGCRFQEVNFGLELEGSDEADGGTVTAVRRTTTAARLAAVFAGRFPGVGGL